MKKDTRKWCWAESDTGEEWNGPFDSRGAAIAAAMADGNELETCAISRCNYVDVADAAKDWADSLDPLEALHDSTDEVLQDYDGGETYKYRDGIVKARANLTRAIVAWATKHVETRWFCADADAMEIVELAKK